VIVECIRLRCDAPTCRTESREAYSSRREAHDLLELWAGWLVLHVHYKRGHEALHFCPEHAAHALIEIGNLPLVVRTDEVAVAVIGVTT
jgi:hypothetical protein